MIKANTVVRGACILWKGEPHSVVEKEIFAPGKGAAVARLKLKSLKTGHVLLAVIKTTEMIEDVETEHRQTNYSYQTGNQYYFMDPRTFEQFEVSAEVLGDQVTFLKEGESYNLLIYEGKVVSIDPPKKIVFTVTETEQAVKGDTVTAATKPATLDNGAVVKVPLFIKTGDKILVSTDNGAYVSKAN